MGPFDEITIDTNLSVLRIESSSANIIHYKKDMDADMIQFYFCLKGQAKFMFNQGAYSLPLKEERSLLLYNPQKALPLNLEVEGKSWIICLFISIKRLHSLFSSEAEFIPFLSPDNKEKKYYQEEIIPPAMAIVLNQMFNSTFSTTIKNLYFTGKRYELLSLLFNQNEDLNIENCPFLSDEEDIVKIRKAKDILLQQMTEPPTLQELADEVGINIKKLKIGFKSIYGDTVFGFLLNYKMEYARKLLDNKTYNVNEVGLKLGYSSASHFISAFKKKFGITPKKYLTSITSNL